MKQIDIKSALGKEDVINIIGQQWMLVTAGTKEKFNTMTASWGGIGYLWNKPVAFVFIRPERYTHEFIEKSERLTLSFAVPLYEKYCEEVSAAIGKPVGRGVFGADMQVSLVNDGPVTIIIDSRMKE